MYVLLGTGETGGKETEGLGHILHQRMRRQGGGLMDRSRNIGKRNSSGMGAG